MVHLGKNEDEEEEVEKEERIQVVVKEALEEVN